MATPRRVRPTPPATGKRCAWPCARRCQRDPRVFLMGEDVGRYGGSYAVLQGPAGRVRRRAHPRHAPVGVGLRRVPASARRWAACCPIVEIMTVNFSLLALDQIVNNAATLRHMSGGQFNIPLVIRMATGAGRQLAAQHSHSLEGLVCAHPGAAGRRAGDARGRARHAVDRARGSRPGDHLRACAALQPGGRARRRMPVPWTSTAQPCAARAAMSA